MLRAVVQGRCDVEQQWKVTVTQCCTALLEAAVIMPYIRHEIDGRRSSLNACLLHVEVNVRVRTLSSPLYHKALRISAIARTLSSKVIQGLPQGQKTRERI